MLCICHRRLYFNHDILREFRRISSALIIGCLFSTCFICIRQGHWNSLMVEALPKLNTPGRFGDLCQTVLRDVTMACVCREWMPLFKTNARVTKPIDRSQNQMRCRFVVKKDVISHTHYKHHASSCWTVTHHFLLLQLSPLSTSRRRWWTAPHALLRPPGEFSFTHGRSWLMRPPYTVRWKGSEMSLQVKHAIRKLRSQWLQKRSFLKIYRRPF